MTNIYYDKNDNKKRLSKGELEYFYTMVDNIKRILNIEYKIINDNIRDDDPFKIKFGRLVLGYKYKYIKLDNTLIHEKYHNNNYYNVTLEEVICHELAHIKYPWHIKEHTDLTNEYLDKVIKQLF